MLFPDKKHHKDQERVTAPEEGWEWELPGVGASGSYQRTRDPGGKGGAERAELSARASCSLEAGPEASALALGSSEASHCSVLPPQPSQQFRA